MTALNLADRLDRLHLAPAVKTELEQAMQEQAKRDAERLKAKDAEILAKDIKI